MPIEIYIAILAVSSCIVLLTVVFIAAAVYLRLKADSMARSVSQLNGELSELIQESRAVVREMRQAAARVSGPMEDLEHITRTARGWTDRADRVIDAVGTVAEPPLFFLSRNIKSVGGVVSGVMQLLLNSKK